MTHKLRLHQQLTRARQFSESLLSAFKSPECWVHQVHPRANHPLWFAGHMGVVDNFMISLVAPERAAPRPEFQERFGVGSQPSGNLADYPPVEEVLAYMRERRATLLDVLAGLADEDLNTPTPKGAPDFLADFGAVFQAAAWHEGLHTGQVSVVHRALGNPPLVPGQR